MDDNWHHSPTLPDLAPLVEYSRAAIHGAVDATIGWNHLYLIVPACRTTYHSPASWGIRTGDASGYMTVPRDDSLRFDGGRDMDLSRQQSFEMSWYMQPSSGINTFRFIFIYWNSNQSAPHTIRGLLSPLHTSMSRESQVWLQNVIRHV